MNDNQLTEREKSLIAKGIMRAPGTDKRKKRLNPALMDWAVEDYERRHGIKAR